MKKIINAVIKIKKIIARLIGRNKQRFAISELKNMGKYIRDRYEELEDPSISLDLEDMDNCHQIFYNLERIIDRIYPEKTSKEFRNKLNANSDLRAKIYEALLIIGAILKEHELFGFENLKPVKEKTEQEWKIRLGGVEYTRKKKTE